MSTLIFGLILGIVLVLTVENTIMIHRKPTKDEPRAKTRQEEEEEAEWNNLMNYKQGQGRR